MLRLVGNSADAGEICKDKGVNEIVLTNTCVSGI